MTDTEEKVNKESSEVNDSEQETAKVPSSENEEHEKINNEEHHNNHKHFDVKKTKEYLELAEENAKLKDQLLRKQAEFENYRKRTNEERAKEKKYCMQDFFSEAIDTIDIFDQAVSVQTDDEKLKKYLIGFTMIDNRLKTLLENYGVQMMNPINKPFDPNFHDAIESVEKEGVDSNVIIEVVQRGYMYKDRVLRHARVKVSK